MNICFILDEWQKLTPETNSCLRIVHEAVKRKHKVAILHPRHLAVQNNVVLGNVNFLQPPEKISENFATFHKKMNFRQKRVPLKGFDIIFLLKNPPLNSLMLNFLDSLKQYVTMVNDIDGIRKANNKLYTTTFEDSSHYIPETYVSNDAEYLYSVIKESPHEKMILKPLNGYGGHGVIFLEKKAKHNIRSLLDFYIDPKGGNNYIILQEYVPGADEGDVRILLLNGEPIGAMKRVPSEEDLRSNIHSGGTAVKHVITKDELALCRQIGPKLVEDGIFWAGLDLIKGKLLEVNVLSPGGIVRINNLNRVRLQEKVLDFLEMKYLRRKRFHSDMEEMKQQVVNA